MGNNIVKSVLVTALLIVLSFSVGVAAADDAKGSVMIIAATCAIVAMLCVGKKAWLIMLFMPYYALNPVFPLGVFPGQTLTYFVGFLVLLYWITLRIAGKVRFEWKSLPVIDVLFFILIALVFCAFYRQPVSIKLLDQILGIDSEYIGGKGYYMAIMALMGYLAYSLIPTPLNEIEKYVKYVVWFAFICGILATIHKLVRPSAPVAIGMEEQTFENSRVAVFSGISILLFIYIYGTKKISTIVTSVRYVGLLLFATFGCMITGFRGTIVNVMCVCTMLAFLKREFFTLLCIAFMAVCMVYAVSEANMLIKLPFAIQRVLSPLPGVKIEKSIAANAQHSLDTRYEMWKVAMDKRTGAIKNYVWGDGFGVKKQQLKNLTTLKGNVSLHEGLMAAGDWHSGPISLIHRVGYVGFAVVNCMMLYGVLFIYRTLKAYLHHPVFPIVVIILIRIYSDVFQIYGSVAELQYFLCVTTMTLLMAKLFYCEGIKHGLITPMFRRIAYIPLAVQERQREEINVPEYPLSRKLKRLQNKQV